MGVDQSDGRRGVDSKLIIALVVIAIGAGVFWWIKSRPDPEIGNINLDPSATYTLVCQKCAKTFPIVGTERAKMKMQDGYYQCPQCSEFIASFGTESDLKPKKRSDQPTEIMP